ncbi:MAG: hypothetical protein HY581_00740 [Nitrospirae bacterium]|nr:hypothetical protein [Nitrospirota bacterium]
MRLRGRLRMYVAWGLAFGIVSLLFILPRAVWADPQLHKLECVNIQAAVLESGASLGVTTEVLREALLTGVKTKLPRLRVDPSCPNRIFFKVFLQNLSGGMIDGFYGHVAFEVRRKAAFVHSSQSFDARAWDLESYVHGTREKAKASVLDQLNSHLTQFAADYQAANP